MTLKKAIIFFRLVSQSRLIPYFSNLLILHEFTCSCSVVIIAIFYCAWKKSNFCYREQISMQTKQYKYFIKQIYDKIEHLLHTEIMFPSKYIVNVI